jgi:hypothetical protein
VAQVWASRAQIDQQRAKLDAEKIILSALNSESIKARDQASASEAYYKAMVAQHQAAETAGTAIHLTAQERQIVAGPSILRSLQEKHLSLIQDRAAESAKSTPDPKRIGEINANVAQIEQQLNAFRKQTGMESVGRTEQQAKNRMTGDQTLARQIGLMKQEKENVVRTLTQSLMSYDQEVSDLMQSQIRINALRLQTNHAGPQALNENPRGGRMIPEPAVPTHADLPDWRWYFPTGAGGGLLVGYFLTAAFSRRRPR